MRQDFPCFRIWSEVTGDRTRYVARRLPIGTGPHTVVTADLDELRAILNDFPTQPHPRPAASFDTAAPNIARMYDRWLGGKDNFDADRQAADAVAAQFPEITDIAKANRAFVIRAVAYVAAQGITQYLDIGAGLPATPTVRQTAQRANPAARVVYIDNDPIVLAHARAILAAGPGVAVIDADLRQPAAILTSPELRGIIDLNQPVCVVLAAVLHFLPPAQADTIVAAFRQAIAPGSYLIASSGTSTGTSPALIARLAAAYQDTATVVGRTVDEIAGYFTGLQLVPPGLTDVWAWRPDTQPCWTPPRTARILGAVGCKPAAPTTPVAHQPGNSVTI
jgi:O-methyltransferase involved in polyketide biosynthesis